MKARLFPTRALEYKQRLREAGCSETALDKTVEDIVKGIEAQGIGPVVIQCEHALICVDMAHIYFDTKAPQGILKASGIKLDTH